MEKLPSFKSSKGFTLIELMVVIAIIAILAVAGITVYTGVQKSGQDSRRKQDVQAISAALESHINETTNQNCTGAAGVYCAPVATWFASGAIPVDPGTSASYTGLPADGAASYNVCATLSTAATFCLKNQQ